MNPSRVIVHRVPTEVATSIDEYRHSAAGRAYEQIVLATAPLDIAKAMVHADGFDVTPFGIDDTHFHYGCDPPPPNSPPTPQP